VIAAVEGKPLQPVHLQKILFLLSKLTNEQLKTESFYAFTPYDYGPFCANVYSDAEQLAREELIQINSAIPSTYRTYAITRSGAILAESIKEQLSPAMAEYVVKLVSWISSLSFNQLVAWIYKMYPEMKVNSVFQET
jgi:hypothetical protein